MALPRSIALVGLPAVGKSTIGRRLAQLLNRPFIDLDRLIEKEAGATIASLFEMSGESHFRDLELRALDEVSGDMREAVIATGGGIVVDGRCRSILIERTRTVYLRAPVGSLLPRLKRNGKRPLFQAADASARLLELEQHREPLYREVAFLTVDVQCRGASHVAAEIAELLEGAARRASP